VEYLLVIKMALSKMHNLQPQIIIFLAQSQLQQASYKEEFLEIIMQQISNKLSKINLQLIYSLEDNNPNKIYNLNSKINNHSSHHSKIIFSIKIPVNKISKILSINPLKIQMQLIINQQISKL